MSEMTDLDVPMISELRDVLSLSADSKIEIQGTVSLIDRVHERFGASDHREVGLIRLDTNSGEILVRVNNPACTFAGGPLEHVAKKPIELGDVIRVVVATTAQSGYVDAGCAPIYLSTPSLRRLEEYERLREDIHRKLRGLIDMVGTKEYEGARWVFSDLRKLELTEDETAQIEAFIDMMPRHEQPVHLPTTATAQKIEEVHTLNVETMNSQEFLEFAEETMWEWADVGNEVSDFFLLQEFLDLKRFSAADKTEFLIAAINVAQLKLLMPGSEQVASDGAKQLLESIKRLGMLDHVNAFTRLSEIGEWCLRNRYFDIASNDKPLMHERFSGLIEAIFDALYSMFQRDLLLQIDSQEDLIWPWQDMLLDADATLKTMVSFGRLLIPSDNDEAA